MVFEKDNLNSEKTFKNQEYRKPISVNYKKKKRYFY
jgi:hypothetical protein